MPIIIKCRCGHERDLHYRERGVCLGDNCRCIEFKFDIQRSIPEQKKVVKKEKKKHENIFGKYGRV